MKKTAAWLLIAIMLFGMMPAAAFALAPQEDPQDTGEEEAIPGLTVKKVWNDNQDHSEDEVTVALLRDGYRTGETAVLNEANGWKHTFPDLDAGSADGQEPVYYVEETEINGKNIYQQIYEGKYKEPVIEVTKPKTEIPRQVEQEDRWTVINYNDRVAAGGEYAFVGVDDSRYSGSSPIPLTMNNKLEVKDLEYVNRQFKGPDGTEYWGYFKGVEADNVWKAEAVDGYDLLKLSNSNSYLALTGSEQSGYSFITTDNGEPRDENGVIVNTAMQFSYSSYSSVIVTMGTADWRETIDSPVRFLDIVPGAVTAAGSPPNYGLTVLKKVPYSGTETSISEEITITNEEVVPDKGMTVKKSWDDSEDHSGDSVTIQLLANGEPVDGKDVELDAGNNWEYTYTNLDKTDDDGNEIVYYAKETAVNGTPIEELTAEGLYETPEVAVTTGIGEEEETVQLTKDYWVPVTERKADGTWKLEDGGTYAILTNDWTSGNCPIALRAQPQYNALTTDRVSFAAGPIEINGVSYSEYLEDLPQQWQWQVTVDSDEFNLYRFSNSGKYLTLAGRYDDPYRKYRFLLTSENGYSEYQDRYYQPQLQLQSKDGGTIIAGRVTFPDNSFEDMYMYMKNGWQPTEYCTNEFSAQFMFYKKVTVDYSAEVLKQTPEEITITNRKITKVPADAGKSMTVVKKWDDEADHSKDQVTVQLLSNNVPVAGSEKILSAENNWTCTYADLKGKDAAGSDIVYFVKETKINGKAVEDLVKSGAYETPDIQVTKASTGTVVEKEVEVEREYWVPVQEKKDDGTYRLEDGETYAIVTNDWKNDNKPIALTADPTTDSLITGYVHVKQEEVIADDGTVYDRHLAGVSPEQQWQVGVVDESLSLYRFSNAGKNLTLAGKYHDPFRKYRFILTSREDFLQYEGKFYQPTLQLQSKDGGTILAGRITSEDGISDTMYMFMKDGVLPTEYCTDEFPAHFEFYKKITVKEKETVQEVTATPEEVTITNRTLPPELEVTVNESTAAKKSPGTSDAANPIFWGVLAAGAVLVLLKAKVKTNR